MKFGCLLTFVTDSFKITLLIQMVREGKKRHRKKNANLIAWRKKKASYKFTDCVLSFKIATT